jgi:uncharacterized protein (TIGR01777 family)
MKLLIAGGTGFIGQYLVKKWAEANEVTIITRREQAATALFGDAVRIITWDQLDACDDAFFRQFTAIVNLCGEGIAKGRWTEKRKQRLLDSRIVPTQKLAQRCIALGEHSPCLINASGIGIYGTQRTIADGLPLAFDESSPVSLDQQQFLPHLACQWEQATQAAIDVGVRVICLRLAMVLGQGGALAQLALPVKFGVGAILGSGHQPVSWVSVADVSRAIEFCIKHSKIQGAVNCVSPGTVMQKTLMKAIGAVLRRPIIFTLPKVLLHAIFGQQMAQELMLNGQHVKSKKLQQAGFSFKHPDLKSALIFALKGGD